MPFHRDANEPQRPPADGGVQQLIDETEAFLAGGLAEAIETHTGAVPDWAWINGLAHGSTEQLTAWASVRLRRNDTSWRHARTLLAGDVLAAAETHGPLDRLQHDALVPLELRLAAMPALVASPAQLITRVLTALALDKAARGC